MTDGLQVRLLWSEDDDRLWVSLLDTRSGRCFRLEVDDDERPLDVFHHPFAYAAHHDIGSGILDRQPVPEVMS